MASMIGSITSPITPADRSGGMSRTPSVPFNQVRGPISRGPIIGINGPVGNLGGGVKPSAKPTMTPMNAGISAPKMGAAAPLPMPVS